MTMPQLNMENGLKMADEANSIVQRNLAPELAYSNMNTNQANFKNNQLPIMEAGQQMTMRDQAMKIQAQQAALNQQMLGSELQTRSITNQNLLQQQQDHNTFLNQDFTKIQKAASSLSSLDYNDPQFQQKAQQIISDAQSNVSSQEGVTKLQQMAQAHPVLATVTASQQEAQKLQAADMMDRHNTYLAASNAGINPVSLGFPVVSVQNDIGGNEELKKIVSAKNLMTQLSDKGIDYTQFLSQVPEGYNGSVSRYMLGNMDQGSANNALTQYSIQAAQTSAAYQSKLKQQELAVAATILAKSKVDVANILSQTQHKNLINSIGLGKDYEAQKLLNDEKEALTENDKLPAFSTEQINAVQQSAQAIKDQYDQKLNSLIAKRLSSIQGNTVIATPEMGKPIIANASPAESSNTTAKTNTSSDLLNIARYAILQGADQNAVINRLKSMGVDITGL